MMTRATSIRVRNYLPSDAAKIDEIYKRCHGHFALPDISHCIKMAVVESKEGQIIAFGAFELIPELTLVLDNDRPKSEQVMALKELLDAGDLIAKLNGFETVYAFPDSNVYANILKKHFGFEDCQIILAKKVGG